MSINPITNIAAAQKLLDIPTDELLTRANQTREAHFGRKITLCAIINTRSGNCPMDCSFCSQSRRYSAPIANYPLLDEKTLLERILALAKLPVAHIGLVTSGAALNIDEIKQVTQALAKLPEDVQLRVCTSFGRISSEGLELLKQAKIGRYHHNLETSKGYYPKICTTQTWQARKETVLAARKVGMSNCTGGLFGLGESWLDRLEFALELQELQITQIPMNFLHPQPGTPLANQPVLTEEEALRIIAIFRLILPKATLRICGGRPITFKKREREIFQAGANALMVGDYLTTAGQGAKHDLELLASLGLEADYPC